MNRKLSIALITVAIITSTSCKKEIGIWDDCIKLSAKTAEFSSEGDSVTITTEGDWWWINYVSVNDSIFHDYSDANLESDTYSFKQDCFEVEKRDKKTLFIKVEENPLPTIRTISVKLEAGDYFDKVTITQAAKQ